jgi:hypothetical protein
MDYTALRTEIQTDPTQLGYAALVASGSDAGIATLLNTPTTTQINRGIITRSDFMYLFGFVFTNVAGLADSNIRAGWAWNLQLVNATEKVNLSSAGINGDLAVSPPIIGVRQQAVATGLCTDAQWVSIAYRPGTRAEVLWGVGSAVSANDVSIALRGTT